MKAPNLYFDYNATSPLDPLVKAEMMAFLELATGNPSSLHSYGQEARQRIAKARGQVARLIAAHPDEIIFTSGGTESNNMVLFGAAMNSAQRRGRIVTTAIEHQSVLNPCRVLAKRGHAVSFVRATADGKFDLECFSAELHEPPLLASAMLANNDTGALQPIAEAALIAHSRGVVFHTDAVQAAGKIPIDVIKLGVDYLSMSAHKLHGPTGIGVLYVRRGCHLSPLLFGGHQEHSLRPGTENAVAIVGFGKACELAALRLETDAHMINELSSSFETRLLERLPDISINAQNTDRLPNTSNIRFDGIDSQTLIMNLDFLGLAASGGSACNASEHEPSHVLTAMGQSHDQAHSSVRFSIGRETTVDDIDLAVERIVLAVSQIRKSRHASR